MVILSCNCCLALVHGLTVGLWVSPRQNFYGYWGGMRWCEFWGRCNLRRWGCRAWQALLCNWRMRTLGVLGCWARTLLSHTIFLRVHHTQSIIIWDAVLWGPRWPHFVSILLLDGYLKNTDSFNNHEKLQKYIPVITTHDLAFRFVSAEIKSVFGCNWLWNTVL